MGSSIFRGRHCRMLPFCFDCSAMGRRFRRDFCRWLNAMIPARYLMRAIGVLIGLMLLACTPSPPIAPVTPTAAATQPPTRTPQPTPALTPDPFCRDDFVVADGQGGLMCRRTRVAYKFIGINIRELAYVGDQNQSLTKADVYRVDLTSANPGRLARSPLTYTRRPPAGTEETCSRRLAHTVRCGHPDL